jgi:hypothetical protein
MNACKISARLEAFNHLHNCLQSYNFDQPSVTRQIGDTLHFTQRECEGGLPPTQGIALFRCV